MEDYITKYHPVLRVFSVFIIEKHTIMPLGIFEKTKEIKDEYVLLFMNLTSGKLPEDLILHNILFYLVEFDYKFDYEFVTKKVAVTLFHKLRKQ